MTFNLLKEKGMPLEKQLRNWHQIVAKPYKNKRLIAIQEPGKFL